MGKISARTYVARERNSYWQDNLEDTFDNISSVAAKKVIQDVNIWIDPDVMFPFSSFNLALLDDAYSQK